MTAMIVMRVALVAAAVAVVGFVAVARRLCASEPPVSQFSLVVAGVAGSLATFLAVLPAVSLLARAAPSTAVVGAVVGLVPMALVAGALFLQYGRMLSAAQHIGVGVMAGLPGLLLATGIGTVGGAVRSEKACEGNLMAIGHALKEYVADHGTWPLSTNWMDELLPYLPYPSVYRCPAASAVAYPYKCPPEDAGDDFAVIVCPHRFLGEEVVLRKDLKVETRGIRKWRAKRRLPMGEPEGREAAESPSAGDAIPSEEVSAP